MDNTDDILKSIERWEETVKFISSGTERINHPEFLRIIKFGRPAVPVLLKKLRNGPIDLAVALSMITGVDPVPDRFMGRRDKVVEFWFSWAMTQENLREFDFSSQESMAIDHVKDDINLINKMFSEGKGNE